MVEHSRASLDRTYAALAHPVRRDIITRLKGGSFRVTEIASGYDISLAAASKHIGVLEGAGLLERVVRGREHHLGLDPRPLADAADWIEASRAGWEQRLDALDAMLRRQR